MVMKKCIICGKEFDAKGRQICCSDECKLINKRAKVNARVKKCIKNGYDKFTD